MSALLAVSCDDCYFADRYVVSPSGPVGGDDVAI